MTPIHVGPLSPGQYLPNGNCCLVTTCALKFKDVPKINTIKRIIQMNIYPFQNVKALQMKVNALHGIKDALYNCRKCNFVLTIHSVYTYIVCDREISWCQFDQQSRW